MNVESVIKWLIALIIVVSLVFAGYYLINYALREYQEYKQAVIMREKGNVVREFADTAQGFMNLGFSEHDRNIKSVQRNLVSAAKQIQHLQSRSVGADLNPHIAAQEATICKLIGVNKSTIDNYKQAIVSYLGSGLERRSGQVQYAKKRIARSAAEMATLEKKLYQLRLQATEQSK